MPGVFLLLMCSVFQVPGVLGAGIGTKVDQVEQKLNKVEAKLTRTETKLDEIAQHLDTLLQFFKIQVPVDDDKYLYLSPTNIIHIPTFEQLSCPQNFKSVDDGSIFKASSVDEAFGSLVTYQGEDVLMICSRIGCQVKTEDGWKDTKLIYNRHYAAYSKLADGRWLVTGGMGEGWPGNPSGWLNSTLIYSDGEGWSEHLPLPVGHVSHCQVTVGTETFVIGGLYRGSVRKSGYKYGLNENNWKLLGQLITPRYDHMCAVYGGRIYVIGGVNNKLDNTAKVEIYDPSNPSLGWSAGPTLPTPLGDGHAIVHDNVLYVLGGRTDAFKANTEVFKLNKDEEWEVVPNVIVTQDWKATYQAPLVNKDDLHCDN